MEVDPNLPLETETQPETETPQPESEPTVPETPADEPAADAGEPEIDYKAKFAESTREAQILAAQLEAERRRNSQELTNEPTESDLQAAFPEWEMMTDTEKTIARRTFKAERTASSLQQKDEEREAQSRWNTDLEMTIAANPSLLGKEQAFKTFANKPTHRGAPLETLVSAFLFESSSLPSAPRPTPKPGLLPGNGGPRGSDKPKLLSGEELKTLRQTDTNAYREYVKTHPMSEFEA